MRKQKRKIILLVGAGVGCLLVVLNMWILFAVDAEWQNERVGGAQLYGAWDNGDVDLRELPSAEEVEKRVRELFAVDSVPVVNLTTEESVTVHGVYKDMSMVVTDDKIAGNNYGKMSGKMKPRGNSTYKIGLQYGAMPFKIKLDEAVDLLGMGKSKKWCLIANFIDRSYVKQFIMYQTAQLIMGEEYFQPKAKYVEVNLNGEYKGLYLLTESIEEDEGRLGLEVDLEEYGEEIPFLLEMEQKDYICEESYKELIEDHFSSFRFFADSYEDVPTWLLDEDKENDDCSLTPYDLKYPEAFSEMSDEQYAHIRKTMYGIYEGTKLGVPIGQVGIDANSFVNQYLFMELFANPTFVGPSVYVYQKPGSGVVTAGPLWDFDTVMFGTTEGSVQLERNTIYKYLYQYRAFRQALVSRYKEYEEKLFPAVKNAIADLRGNQVLKQAVLKAEAKYHTWTRSLDGHNGFPGPSYDIFDKTILSLKTFEAQVDHISGWLFDGFRGVDGDEYGGRINWMKDELVEEWGQ
ncbi:MAG: CotH kinase family protein [Candidatus Nomurabacteria bacterium]|nr:CotH kinase family protein [Candidatus Nomurabacteria bacterium]